VNSWKRPIVRRSGRDVLPGGEAFCNCETCTRCGSPIRRAGRLTCPILAEKPGSSSSPKQNVRADCRAAHRRDLPRRRGDGPFQPDLHGVIETADGATVLFDSHGHRRSYPEGRPQIVAAITHVSDAPAIGGSTTWSAWSLENCMPSGPAGAAELVADVAELIWEPPGQ
jgi:hypothetical protein